MVTSETRAWIDPADAASLKPAERGIVYAVMGQKYADEASESAATVRRRMPGVPIILFSTDRPSHGAELFDEIIVIRDGRGAFEDKLQAMIHSPFARTLYLDTDIFLYDSIIELFDLLDRSDFCAAFDPSQRDPAWVGSAIPELGPELPGALIEYNLGLIGFRASDAMKAFIASWLAAYVRARDAHGVRNDQPSFRKALHDSNLRMTTLPAEYNFRTVLAGMATAKVKVLHGRHPNMDKLEKRLNRTSGARFYVPGIGVLSRDMAAFKVLGSIRRNVSRLRGK